ncbi:MAG TPA: hypothetical protein VGZ69_04270 [Candidatus Rhabdochlamydia sp.]|jgi:hypothetical protein|nr:hypothetical protein [Candidatus Rhabdochlamydia sp.]
MSQSIGFLKPTYYIPKEDEQLKAIVQMISDHKQEGGLNGHGLAIAKAVHSIALVIFTNIPYYFALGSKNLILNCTHLNLELIVLGHYNAAIQNLIYSVIAVIYVTIGIFIPPVLDGFKMKKSQPDDSNTPPDSSLSIIIEGQEEPEIRSPSLDERRSVSILSTQSGPISISNSSSTHSFQDMLLASPNCFSAINSSLSVTEDKGELQMREPLETPTDSSSGMPSIESRMETRSSRSSYNSIPSNTPSVNYVKEEFLKSSSDIENEHESGNSISSQQHSIQTSSIGLDSLASGDWSMIPNVGSSAIKSVGGIYVRDMIGANGVNLERQAYRIALNEYIRILKDDFGIDVNERLMTFGKWLENPIYKDNPIVNALYHTLLYLTRPVAYSGKDPIYTHAKEQYEKYVISLREVIATEQYQSIRKNPNLIGELKECLTLTRRLCEARFRPENHGRLHSLLQLHKDEYDRLHPERKEIPAVTRENFAQVVMAKNKKVTEAPASMKVSSTQRNCRMAYGAIGVEDFLMTDIPFVRGEQTFLNNEGEERSFYYMRHPTPHVAGSLFRSALGATSRTFGFGHIESGEAIAPEFKGMLEAIAERGESYLIQSHQRLNDTGTIENEDSRSKTLYDLQTSHKNFHAVFQAVEGDLFDHKDSYAEIKTFADLKEAIKASFYMEGSPNRLPAYLEKDEEYRNSIINQLLDQVHQALFRGRTDISFDGQEDPTQPGENYPNREWQAFILAFYILQGDDLKFRLPNVKYFCTNCKNFFDRGGNRAMAEDRLHQEMSERKVTSEDLEATITNLIPVPLQSKGKAVIEKRLKPGLALAEILATLSIEDRQRLRGINFGGYQFNRFEVSKKEQRAVPLIKDVCTLQEMQDVLKALQGKSYCIIDNSIIQNNWEPYQGKDRDHLFDQVNKGFGRSEVHVDKTCYNGQGSNNAEGIFEYLKTCGINEDLALQAIAQMQQSILFEPFKGLMEAFQHDELGLIVAYSPGKSTIDVLVTKDSVEIKAQNRLLYRTTNSESAYFRESTIAVFNTIVSATIPKDGSAPNAHWTWEIAEVLV